MSDDAPERYSADYHLYDDQRPNVRYHIWCFHGVWQANEEHIAWVTGDHIPNSAYRSEEELLTRLRKHSKEAQGKS